MRLSFRSFRNAIGKARSVLVVQVDAVYPGLAKAQAHWRHLPAEGSFAGKTVLVTGAGDGIGRALAKALALYGANLVLLGKTRTKLEAVFDWIAERSATKPVIVPCDLGLLDQGAAAALADQVQAEFGRLDGLVHNASALGAKTPVEHYPLAEWEAVMRVNLTAAIALTQALTPLMRETGRVQGAEASIVFTSSSVGREGRAYWGAYAASKFAIEGLMQVLADEFVHEGAVRVNSLNPGGTRTAMRRQAYPGEDPTTVPPPETRLDLCLYLLSDAAKGVTGQALDARTWAGP